jgi:ArsR family transcriptional regulator, arsenate/arsenite/antimonite-responsive transcriptional repressor
MTETVRWMKKEQELASLAWGLAHPARIAILKLLLSRGECVCGAIVEEMPLAQATVSQHLKVLKETGWIQGEIDGPRVCYCPTKGAMARFQECLQSLNPGERR